MKGLIAALIGVGLLGSYGTFALWSDSDNVTSGDITAGNLDITKAGTPSWYDISPASSSGWTGPDVLDENKVGDPKKIENISAFRMVPGDLLQYEAKVTVIATGENMLAQLVVDAGSVDIPNLLRDHVGIKTILKDSDGDVLDSAPIGTPITFAINGPTAAAGVSYTVLVRVGFDGGTPNQKGTGETIDLSNLRFDLRQVRS